METDRGITFEHIKENCHTVQDLIKLNEEVRKQWMGNTQQTQQI